MSWKNNNTGTGWSLSSNTEHVSILIWGGTIDAIRALIFIGENLSNYKIKTSIEWLLNKQNINGGWSSSEIDESNIEVTCWTTITLNQIKENYLTVAKEKAIKYILSIQKSNGSWPSYLDGESRVYPTLLAIWALYESDESLISKGLNWLIKAKNKDGGWGFKYKDENSNSVMTSMVLIVLNKYSIPDLYEINKQATKFIRNNMNKNYIWDSITEQYITYEKSQKGNPIYTTCHHFTTAWAIIALVKFDTVITNELVNSIIKLLNSQLDDGSWFYTPSNIHKYTWCVSNAICALKEVENYYESKSNSAQFILNQKNINTRNNIIHIIMGTSLIINSILIIYILLSLKGALSLASKFASILLKYFLQLFNASLENIIAPIIVIIISPYVIKKLIKSRKKDNHL